MLDETVDVPGGDLPRPHVVDVDVVEALQVSAKGSQTVVTVDVA